MTETVLFRGGIKDLPVGVRSVSISKCNGHNVPEFWCSLGLQQAHESVKEGQRFSIELLNETLQVRILAFALP